MKKIEELAPITYQYDLQNRKIAIDAIIKLKSQQLQRAKQLENAGHIRIVPHRHALQFYLITKKGDTIGKYLPSSKKDFAKSILKYNYDKKALSALKTEQSHIKKLLNFIQKKSVEAVFAGFSKYKKQLLTPLTFSEKEYANQWQSVEYTGKGFDFTSTEFYTAKGERVRSKSEVIIADTLARNNIPYRYEFPLDLKNYPYPVYPDFCCLNVRTRQEFYWEHFGMMDDSEYAINAVAKIDTLAANNYVHGKNAIFTFETTNSPLNNKIIEKMIGEFLQ